MSAKLTRFQDSFSTDVHFLNDTYFLDKMYTYIKDETPSENSALCKGYQGTLYVSHRRCLERTVEWGKSEQDIHFEVKLKILPNSFIAFFLQKNLYGK